MIPASIRNRNPGAQYPGPSARKFGGEKFEVLKSKDGTHKIATFPTSVHGAAAQFHLLHNGRNKLGQLTYRNKSIKDAIATWCGGFYVSTYLNVLQTRAGVTPETTLTSELLCDPAFAVPLAKAMAQQEAGKPFPMDDDDWSQAHAMAFADTHKAPAFSPDNDVPSPKPETRTAETMKTAATIAIPTAGAVATIANAVTDTASKAPIPPPPEVLKTTVETLGAYQGISTTIGGMIDWMVASPVKAGIGVILIVGLGWLLPWLERGRA